MQIVNEELEVRLYGVITKILPNDEFVKCTPVFCKCDFSNFRSCNPPYYRYKKNSDGEIIGLEEFDIKQYGPKIFLPANHKKINDGKEYLVVCQQTKCYNLSTHSFGIPWARHLYKIITVGILFPKKFTYTLSLRELSEEELLCRMS